MDYHKFAFLIKNESRDPNGSWCQNFSEGLLATCQSRIVKMPENTKLWRSQLGRDKSRQGDTTLRPFPPFRMKPIPNEAKEGRANPSGVPVLYLSTDRETAMAECRPWLAAYISIGMFYTSRDLKILDLSKDEYIPIGINDKERKNNDQHFIEKVTWGYINKAFTKPVQLSAQIADNKLAQEIAEFLNPNKDADYIPLLKKLWNFFKSKNKNADYIPNQKIAEFFKSKNFDGIKYRSALGKGCNVALFDLSSAEQADCSLFDVKDIFYSFEPIDGAKYTTPFGEDQGDYDDT